MKLVSFVVLLLFSLALAAKGKAVFKGKMGKSKGKAKDVCACPANMSLADVYQNSAVVFWAKGVTSKQVVTVGVPLKGCLDKGSRIKLVPQQVKCGLAMKPGKEYLVTAAKKTGKGPGARGFIAPCHWIREKSKVTPAEAAWLVSRQAACDKPPQKTPIAGKGQRRPAVTAVETGENPPTGVLVSRPQTGIVDSIPPLVSQPEQARCPPELPFVQCRRDPCAFARAPRCVAGRDKQLTCVPDYCGSCGVKWLHEGEEFKCPDEPRCLPGADGCCPSGRYPVDCSSQQCPVELCANAERCSLDACSFCSVSFFDADDRVIPRNLCRAPEGRGESRGDGRGEGRGESRGESRGEVSGEGRAPQRPQRPQRDSCSFGDDAGCCEDGLVPFECPSDLEARVCPGLICEGHEIATCKVDGCNFCNVRITDKLGAEVEVSTCRLPAPKPSCPGVVCPDITPYCGARADLLGCPDSVELECVLDPCVCISLWVEKDLGFPPRCAADYRPPCIPQESCPSAFECPPPPADLRMPDIISNNLVCVQEPCTCRPIVTLSTCIAVEDCPAVAPGACGELNPDLAAYFPRAVLDRFTCQVQECTCRPMWVPPPDAMMDSAPTARQNP